MEGKFKAHNWYFQTLYISIPFSESYLKMKFSPRTKTNNLKNMLSCFLNDF